MRLSQHQLAAIRTTATEVFGEQADVWLFGSRVDDRKKGGDIDLLIRPSPQSTDKLFEKKIDFIDRFSDFDKYKMRGPGYSFFLCLGFKRNECQ